MIRKTIFGGAVLAAASFAAMPAQAGTAALNFKGLSIKIDSPLIKVAYQPPRIRRILRNRGYYRINFTDRYLPVYKARACRNGKRFHLRINRWGNIMSRNRIGNCAGGGVYGGGYGYQNPGYRPPKIRRILRNRGFYRINFTDRYLPVYQVRACRNGNRIHLRLNRFGRVISRYRIGRCGGYYGYVPTKVQRYIDRYLDLYDY